MAKIDKILDKTVRKETDAKKWIVVVGIVAGVLIASGLFVGIYHFADVDEYLHDTKEITNLYDFYDSMVGYNTTAVYFIGASHVAESVYPPEINRILKEKGYENITVYSAYVSSECPLDRLIHLQKLIDSKPSMVIYGIAASQISKEELIEDNIIIVKNRLNIQKGSEQFYTDDELSLLREPVNLLDMKRFIKSAILHKITERFSSGIDKNYSVDPLGGADARKYIWGANVDENKIAYLHDSNYIIEYNISNKSRSVEAFNYILNTLENDGINVVVVNAPINPLTSDKITKKTRDSYYSVLNETGYDWYNFEYCLPEEYFFDGIHTTFDGAMELAPRWADIIIQELD